MPFVASLVSVSAPTALPGPRTLNRPCNYAAILGGIFQLVPNASTEVSPCFGSASRSYGHSTECGVHAEGPRLTR